MSPVTDVPIVRRACMLLSRSAFVAVAAMSILATTMPPAARAGDTLEAELDGVLATMARLRIISSPDEWRPHAVKGRFCDGAMVAGMLERLAGALEPAHSRDEPLAVLSRRGMADWLDARQRAVDDARRDTPTEGVQVWHSTEVNHVKIAMQGRPDLVNRVLPRTQVDPVSYSCSDTQDDPRLLKAALTYIELQLPPKPEIAGRRVFIGEYGFPAIRHTPAEQDRLARQVMRAGLEWGTPLILYRRLYNNELEPDGRQRGYWLIDDKGAKQPAYETHASFLAWARRHAADATSRTGRPPSATDFRTAAIECLDATPAADR